MLRSRVCDRLANDGIEELVMGDDDMPERLPPEEVESLREEMRQAETRLAILAARSPAVHRLKVG